MLAPSIGGSDFTFRRMKLSDKNHQTTTYNYPYHHARQSANAIPKTHKPFLFLSRDRTRPKNCIPGVFLTTATFLVWSRWSNQGSPGLVRCKFGPGSGEDDGSHQGSNDVDDDGECDEEMQAPAAIAERDASRVVSGMMNRLDVAAKVKLLRDVLRGD